MTARRRPSDRMNHRVFAFQRLALGHRQRGPVGFGELLRFRFQRFGPHVLGRRVHQIAHPGHRRCFRQGRLDPRRIAGQQHARPLRVLLLAIAGEAVLGSLPAMQRRAGFAVGAAVGSSGKLLRQLGHAPARKLRRILDPADREPPVTVGHDPNLVPCAGELLRRQRRALRSAQRTGEFVKTVLVGQMDGGRILSAVRLDQWLVHGFAACPFARVLGRQPSMKRLILVFALAGLAACGADESNPEPQPTESLTPAATPSPTPSPSVTSSGARSVAEETDDFLFEYSYPAEAGLIPELATLLDLWLAQRREELAKDSADARREARSNGFPYNKHSYSAEWKVVAELPR